MTRTKPCARPGCSRLALPICTYCSRSCGMAAVRARQSPERRREMGSQAKAKQRAEDLARLIARVKCFGDTPEQWIWIAYQYGRGASKSAAWRERQVGRRTLPGSSRVTEKTTACLQR